MQFLQNAPPPMQQGVIQQVFSQMEPGQRQSGLTDGRPRLEGEQVGVFR